jgi:hypothetical protein
MDVRVIYRSCPTCGTRFGQPDDPGRKRRFCSDACKQAAYRARKRNGEQAHQRAQQEKAGAAPAKSTPAANTIGPAGPHRPMPQQPPRPLLRRLPSIPPPRPTRPRPAPLRRPARQGGLDRLPRGSADACRAEAEQLRAKYGL